MQKNQKKVCFVSMLAYPLYNKKCKNDIFGGGAAVQLYIISKELTANNNFNVNIILGNDKLTKNRIELLNKIKLYNIRPIKRKIGYYFFSMINLFITLIRINPDVVIQRHADKVTGICALYCKLFKKKFIYSIASLADVTGVHEKGFLGKFFKYGLSNAKYIIAQNKEQVLELEKFKKRQFKNVYIIKNSYKISEVFLENKEHILWVGRAIGPKRAELFIKLAKKFSNETFVMICNKTDLKDQSIRYWNTIHNKASITPNLKFIEHVNFHSINEYYEKAKILVDTSIYAGFPNTMIQAFKNKTPVLSLNVNPENILTNYKIGLFCNDDFNKMVEYLHKLLEDKELYLSYSENCYNYVKKVHDIKENINYWIEVIKNFN
ncbi:MAG: glycosyltransferase family 4 protein [Candidatus Hermodarchaeota archaeon]